MKKYLCLVFVLFVSACLPAKVYKGKCGKNVKWQYITDTQTLYIMGNGTMDDYGKYNLKDKKTPWDRFTELRKVIVCDGVKSIGRHAFEKSENLERVTFPEKANCYISAYAFCGCSKLDSLVISGAITSIGEYAFDRCYNLRTLLFMEGVRDINKSSFSASRIKEVHLPASLVSCIHPFDYCDSLAWISVSRNSKTFSSVSGRLCSKDSTTLYMLPNDELERLNIMKTKMKRWLDLFNNRDEDVNGVIDSIRLSYINKIEAIDSREILWKEKGVFIIESNPLRKVAQGAITGVKGMKHLVIEEGIEELERFSIGGGRDLISISFPSTLKSFVHGLNLCIGAGCTRIQQVFLASEEPEQLFQSALNSNQDNSHFIKYCWVLLEPLPGEIDARKYCKWFVPRSVYSRYKNHPCWGQLNLNAVDYFETTKNIYWKNGDKYSYIRIYKDK